MTYDPSIARDLFRGLIYCGMTVSMGTGLGLLLIAILPTWDEN